MRKIYVILDNRKMEKANILLTKQFSGVPLNGVLPIIIV
jgi:hypothetical protein